MNTTKTPIYFIGGDIGGTKTTVALFSIESGIKQPVFQKTFSSKKHDSLETILEKFVRDCEHDVSYACFGVAGPVFDGKAKITNLPWIIDSRNVSETLGFKHTWLLNDLESLGESITSLDSNDLFALNEQPAQEGGAIAIVAPGTGLGEGFMIWNGTKYQACPSEGGHADFAPGDEVQLELLRYMFKSEKHVSWEQVCSGTYLTNIYNFLKDSGRAVEPKWLKEEIRGLDDINAVITTTAMDENKSCEICDQTLEIFVKILGAEAGNLALKYLSSGGVFLGGGIPPKILPALRKPAFMASFTNKGRFRPFMESVPVHVVLNPQAGLIGAAHYCLAQIQLETIK
ncbi:MAG: glucokinase [Anaerolineales bacterium]|nr:glucokinase [Anaerolineales bacterium]